MKKILFVSILMSFLFLISAQKSFACSCLVSDKPLKTQVKEAFNGAAAVFAGEAVEVAKVEDGFLVKFKVEKSWKGKFSREIKITTNADSAMCGYTFEVGKKYIVYADGSADKLAVYLCSRTALVGGNKDFKYLDKLKKSVKPKSTSKKK
jgi:hypothetical protein